MSPATRHRLPEPVRRLLRLVEPSPAVESPAARRRAAAAAGLVLALIAIGILLTAIPILLGDSDADLTRPTTLVAIVSIILLCVCFFLVRGTHPTWGIGLLIFVTNAAIYLLWYESLPADPDHSTLTYLVIPLILGAFLAGLWTTTTLLAANLAALFLLDPIARQRLGTTSMGALGEQAAFLFLAGALVLLGAAILRLYTADLERQGDALRKAEEDRLRLLNQVVHDLASPLTPIKLQLGILAGEQAAEARARSLAVVRRNTDHIQHLVTDLKDLARLEAGQFPIHFERVDIADVVRDAGESLSPQCPEGVAFETRTDGPLLIQGDRARLTQVMYNLVTNAFKFTPSGGNITVVASRLEDRVTVDVSDTGRGMTAEEAARLFQPFVQLDGPAQTRRTGTGLGLFICRGIVERHGGKISCESPGLGKGTTFAFWVPAGAAAA